MMGDLIFFVNLKADFKLFLKIAQKRFNTFQIFTDVRKDSF